ncbi:hypothetical protein HYC85_018584 [Camellia sinensis]|uniref:Phospholipase A1 n=1 Tax=Camellia sinensis TaxID=4442 RepID=A0A7J7GVN3_CAMSI|nr:hypothetical protein HYC85_018584 [Camellia sinensis]
MCGKRELFVELDETVQAQVSFGDSSKTPVKRRGNILIKLKNGDHDYISNVYYVPAMKNNILRSNRYAKTDLFAKLGLDPSTYRVTKYLYATSSTQVPDAFILKSQSREAWSKESNWMGYVVVATDEGMAKLVRRDIVIAWRGTIQALEWANNLQILLVSPSKIIGEQDDDTKVHQGFYSIYTSNNPRSPFTEASARDQVLTEVRRLVKEYQNEEISITVVGHSLGAAIATLNANRFNIPKNQPDKACPVTAFAFAVAMQVITSGTTSVEEQLATMAHAIEKLTKTVEETNLQIASLMNKLEAQNVAKQVKTIPIYLALH